MLARICNCSLFLGLVAAAALTAVTGCEQGTPVAEFDPNFVHAMKYQIREEVPMDQAMADVHWVTEQMFGTPDEPKLPEFVAEDEDFASLVSMDNLITASGPVGEAGRGLFRQHCVLCHGVSGDGRGPSSAVQNPYPRDYRKGVFKFKSTPRGEKPIREDIAKLIRHGIAGTSMVVIPDLTEENIQALTDYVIYLSWRGELERAIIDEAVLSGDYDFEEGERIIVPEDRDLAVGEEAVDTVRTDDAAEADTTESQQPEIKTTEERVEAFADGWDLATEIAEDIASSWLEADDEVVEVPAPPSDIPVTDNHTEFAAMMQSDRGDELATSVRRGQEVFLSKSALCSTCHGLKGLGDGQTTDYDEWTKDWTLNAGLKPDDAAALVPLLARGALPPINAKPRNFEVGLFHGGESTRDLYLRITQGIDGTPMPSATFVDGKFEEDDVWHLINFIRSKKFESDAKKEEERKTLKAVVPSA